MYVFMYTTVDTLQFVGMLDSPSSSRISGLKKSALAKETLILQPPDSSLRSSAHTVTQSQVHTTKETRNSLAMHVQQPKTKYQDSTGVCSVWDVSSWLEMRTNL